MTSSPAVINLSVTLLRVRSSRAAALEAIASGLLGSSVRVMSVAYTAAAATSTNEMLVADAIAERVLRILTHCSIVVAPLAALATPTHPLPSETAFLVTANIRALRDVAPFCREISSRFAREPWQAVCCAARDAEHAKKELLKHATTSRWDSFAPSLKRSPFTSTLALVTTDTPTVTAADVNTPIRAMFTSPALPAAAIVRIAPGADESPLARVRKLLDEQASRIASRSDASRRTMRRQSMLTPRQAAAAAAAAAAAQASAEHDALRVDVNAVVAGDAPDGAVVSSSGQAPHVEVHGQDPHVAGEAPRKAVSFVMETAAALHTTWQRNRPLIRVPGEKRQRRMKTGGSEEAGSVAVDIANTHISELPKEMQQSNIASAEIACQAIEDANATQRPMTDDFVLEVANVM